MRRNFSSAVFAIIGILMGHFAMAQVGINIPTPHPSAILHLESDSLGFLPPQLTTAERDAIPAPAEGLVIYNVEDSTIQYWNGLCWLHSHQEACSSCQFDLTISDVVDTIDRITVLSSQTQITVNQTSSPTQNIGLIIIPGGIPSGMSYSFSPTVINGSGSVTLTVNVSVFTPPGDYPLIIQGVCDNSVEQVLYTVTVEPCYEVNVGTNQVNYDLQAANGLPGPGTPICVVMDVTNGALFNSADPQNPSYTSGNLDPQSHVGIMNGGVFIGQGGDGEFGGAWGVWGNPGFDGGNAIDLTCQTTIDNTNGFIFGGGGGGGSVGFDTTFCTPSLPVVGVICLPTIGVGAGGGGGAADGLGGVYTSNLLPIFEDGTDATGGLFGVAGLGGALSQSISIAVAVVEAVITPNVQGGDGGNYGVPGTAGFMEVGIDVNAVINIPIIGTQTIPIWSTVVPDPPIASFPAGGADGKAVETNGNVLNGLGTGYYQAAQLKGTVGP